MNTKDEREIEAINIQFYALVIAVVSAIISLIITYNQKLDIEGKETIYDSKETYKLTLFNRILILVLSFIFLYVNIVLYNVSKDEDEDLSTYKLQIFASVLVIISGAIALYVVTTSNTENIVDVENPII